MKEFNSTYVAGWPKKPHRRRSGAVRRGELAYHGEIEDSSAAVKNAQTAESGWRGSELSLRSRSVQLQAASATDRA